MSLWIPIGIRNAAFKSGLDDMRSQAAKFSGDIKGMFAGAFAAGAIIGSFKGWIDEMGRLDDLAQRFGDNAESMQRVGQAASLAGADLELVAKITSQITQKAGDAAAGNEAYAETFDALGINAAKFVSLSLEEKLVALSQAYVDSSGSASKLLSMQELLGAKGQDLIPLLAAGPAALKEELDNAVVSSEAAVKSAARFGDQLEIWGNRGKVVFGYLLQGVDTFVTVMAGGATQIGIYFLGIFEVVQKVAGGVGAALSAMWKGNASEAKSALASIGSEVKETFQDFMDRSQAASDVYAEKLAEIWTGPSETSGPAKLAIDFEAAGEAAKKAADEAEKLKKLKEDVAALEKRNAEAAMTDEQRLQSMIAERAELIKKANDTTEEGLKAKKAAADLEGKIAEAQRRGEKEKADRDKQYQDKLRQAQEAEAQADERLKLAGMSKDEKREYFTKKKDFLYSEAEDLEAEGRSEEAARNRTEAKNIEADLLSQKTEKPTGAKLSVVASGLASVGGGGNVGAIAGDPLLRAQERGNTLLERIATAVEGGRGDNRKQPEVL
jgi:hypothetical protein